MKIEYSARSHVGCVRDNNEDNLYVDGVILTPAERECPFAIDGYENYPAIFAVCDGIGGEENGELASYIAVHKLLETAATVKTVRHIHLDKILQGLVNDINKTIYFEGVSLGKRMGTTMALAVASKCGIHCFNIGDSRIYALHRGKFNQITNDHTISNKQGSKLTRCIGIGDNLAIESYPPIPPNSRILICSDGLTDMVGMDEIEDILRSSNKTANAADYLLNVALSHGGKDNITVIVANIGNFKVSNLRRSVYNMKG